jgi:hypothetical protein
MPLAPLCSDAFTLSLPLLTGFSRLMKTLDVLARPFDKGESQIVALA